MTKKLTPLLFVAFLFTALTDAAQTVNTDSVIHQYCKAKHLKAIKSPTGLYYVIKKQGTGKPLADGDLVKVNYTGGFVDGKIFDSNMKKKYGHKEPFTYTVGSGMVIKGFEEGMHLIGTGGSILLIIPPSLGYGEQQLDGIPANSALVFEVHLLKIN